MPSRGLSRVTEIAKVMLAPLATWTDLHARLRELAEAKRVGLFFEGRKLVDVDPLLRPVFDRFGLRTFTVLNHRPLRLPRHEHESLVAEFARMRRSVRIGRIDVGDRLLHDGGGTGHAAVFVDYIRKRFPGRAFAHALEWCSGPGYIGYALLDAGVCARLSLSDINPDAIDFARHTAERNGLRDRVSCHVGDNLEAIDPGMRFDLVVGNPPWSYTTNDLHNALIANDPGWQIHRRFYSSVGAFVAPGGVVCVSAYEPLQTRARLSGVWDIRPRVPNEDFVEMIRAGGLVHLETVRPDGAVGSTPHGHGMHFVVSTR